MTELHEYTALQLHQLLQRREVSPVELTRHYLDRIERLDGEVGAFATVTPDAALARARHVEEHVPTAAPLWGMPVADKDLNRRAGVPAQFGSRAFAGFVPDESDDLVRAVDAAGAVSLGKTATPEFGLPSYTEALAGDRRPGTRGTSRSARAARAAARRRPWHPACCPSRRAPTEAGRSASPPRSCGLVGMKPSRGRVPSGSGLAGLAGLGVAGPIARTVADAALLLDGLIAPLGYPAAHRFAVRAPGDDGPYLGAAIRGEGRFQLGVMTRFAVGRRVRDRPRGGGALGPRPRDRGVRGAGPRHRGDRRLRPSRGYPAAFRTIWQAGAATIPVDGEAEALLEPLTRWLLERGQGGAGAASSPRRWPGSPASRSAPSAGSRRSTPC